MEENNANVTNSDAENNKWMGVLAYFIFFIPLLVNKESEFCKFHANQGLLLLLLSIAVSIVGSIIPIVGWFIILPIGGLLCLILGIMGIVNAVNLRMKELPLIGKIKIIK